jgi:hypothetical protein
MAICQKDKFKHLHQPSFLECWKSVKTTVSEFLLFDCDCLVQRQFLVCITHVYTAFFDVISALKIIGNNSRRMEGNSALIFFSLKSTIFQIENDVDLPVVNQ